MAEEHLTKAEFLAHMGPIREDIAELVKLQREQNGRVAKTETQIAVLEARDPRDPHAKRDAVGVSAIVSALINGVVMYFSSQK